MYLHLNPVRARLVTHPDQFVWTSHDAYVDKRCCPSWLTTEEMMEYFDTEGGYSKCLEATLNGSTPEPPDFDAILFESRQSARHMMVKQAETASSLSVESALAQVAKLTGVEESKILSKKRGVSGNPARVLAIWWLIYGAGQTNSHVGQILKTSPSAISKILKKLKLSPENYLGGIVAKWQEELL
jgi:REP-associated tyrosine transposase